MVKESYFVGMAEIQFNPPGRYQKEEIPLYRNKQGA